MGLFGQIALVVFAISFMTFVAFFGRLPALRRTPIAWIHRAIWVSIPSGILALDERLTSGRLTASLARFARAFMYDRHPTVLVFFVALLAGGEFLYLPGVWPLLSPAHRALGALSIALPYAFLYLAARADPGFVTPMTHARYMSHYPYDFALFRPGHACRTCGLLKPARSKHCSVCKRCVHKMDHHCVFINNCVGYGNQHWFLLLLLSTAALTTYGAALGLGVVATAARRRAPAFALWKPAAWPWRHYLLILTLGVQDDVGVGSVTLLTAMVAPLVWGLLAYHLYLLYCGTTTNESMKWQDWAAEMADGCAFARPLPAGRLKDPRHEAPFSRWPVEPLQVLRCTEDGAPPPPTGDADADVGVGDWQRVWNLGDVENLYDLGFWDNLVDVFVPNHSFRAEAVADLERGRRHRKPKEAGRASSLVAAAT
ncbi:zf-DHHC-domain-containing protein [Xylariaceae sp. FL0662B]|nr:zf-DHHC-domain-containing protein [Xylariaceae sp. FL0662B]